MSRPSYELADILHRYGEDFHSRFKVPLQHLKVLNAIKICRTSSLGGHVDKCNKCSNIMISYNSCRNRHCPKCQFLKTEQWIENRKADLLPVTYFHVVFTIPSELNDICLINSKELYNILFKSVWEVLNTLGHDKKYLGAQVGAIGVLHTWGQNLMHHPHVHCIVPQGGLAKDKWKYGRCRDFLFPVKVVSRLLRGKFLHYLKEAYFRDRLKFEGAISEYKDKSNFSLFLGKLYRKEWVVYIKQPFKGPEEVIEYLGRYTHRIAISNHRIKDIKEGYVSFSYKDYRDSSKRKEMRLEAVEFIRRFCFHILPEGFMKIRHYGLMSNRQKQLCMKMAKRIFRIKEQEKVKLLASQVIMERYGKDIELCPVCKSGRKKQLQELFPSRGSPLRSILAIA